MIELRVTILAGRITKCDAVYVSGIKSSTELPDNNPQSGVVSDFKPNFADDCNIKIAEDGSSMEADGWTVEIWIKGELRTYVVAKHQNGGVFTFPLSSGVLYLQSEPKVCAYWTEILSAGVALDTLLGIKYVWPTSANRSYEGFSAASGDGVYTIKADFDVVTDGVITTVFNDDTEGAYNPTDPTHRFLYEGKLTDTVSGKDGSDGARWAVVLSSSDSPNGEYKSDVTLYTDSRNLNYICYAIQTFLQQYENCHTLADYVALRRTCQLRKKTEAEEASVTPTEPEVPAEAGQPNPAPKKKGQDKNKGKGEAATEGQDRPKKRGRPSTKGK